jgi:hypothetical protein
MCCVGIGSGVYAGGGADLMMFARKAAVVVGRLRVVVSEEARLVDIWQRGRGMETERGGLVGCCHMLFFRRHANRHVQTRRSTSLHFASSRSSLGLIQP